MNKESKGNSSFVRPGGFGFPSKKMLGILVEGMGVGRLGSLLIQGGAPPLLYGYSNLEWLKTTLLFNLPLYNLTSILSKFYTHNLVKRVWCICVGLVGAVYRVGIHPFLQGQCRFQPSCSRYAQQAFQRYPPLRAFVFILRRLGRCHPWGGQGGADPLPCEPSHLPMRSLCKSNKKIS